MVLDKATKDQLGAISVNEMEDGFTLKDNEVLLVSKAWVMRRDEREIRLLEKIEELKIK